VHPYDFQPKQGDELFSMLHLAGGRFAGIGKALRRPA
jgi:hypothetical protein